MRWRHWRQSVIGSAVERDRMVDGDFIDQVLAERGYTDGDLSPAEVARLRACYAHWYTGPHPGPRPCGEPWHEQTAVRLRVAVVLVLGLVLWFPFECQQVAQLSAFLCGAAWVVAGRVR